MTVAGIGLTGPRTPRWMVAALIGSLAVNLLVVGLVAGASWRGRDTATACRGPTPNLLGYASTLPTDRRKALWARTAEERVHVRPFRRDVRAARDDPAVVNVVTLSAVPMPAARSQSASRKTRRPSSAAATPAAPPAATPAAVSTTTPVASAPQH